MKSLLLYYTVLLILTLTEGRKSKCDGININGKYHKKEVLVNGVNRPYQLSLYNHEHKIFFSYNIGDDDEDKFEIGYVKKGDKLPTTISSIANGFATAIDEEDKKAYFGGSDGIYVDDLTKGKHAVEHVIKGKNVWDMFYKHHLYFIEYPSQRLHKVIQNETELQEHIKEKIYQFVIDGDNDVFITTKDGVYEIKNNTTDTIHYSGPKVFRAIEVDHKGVAHFCGQSAIYVPNKKERTLNEIAHVKNIFGMTFDKDDHIIYSDPHEIVKLLPAECK